MIEIHDLSFTYGEGDFSLRLPELDVASGESIAFVGPSGSGKTTLLNLIAGILLPDKGHINAGGQAISDLDEHSRRKLRLANIGLVFQEFELLEYLNVLDNILLPFRLDRSLKLSQQARNHAVELAGNVGIGDKVLRYPDHLSQGERQRVAVCRAIVTHPKLLLADEPTGNLDPANKGRVLDILFEYSTASGATFVAVTHDHDVLPRFDRVVDFKDFYASDAGRGEEAAS